MNNKPINQKVQLFCALFEKTPIVMRMTLLFLFVLVFQTQAEQSYSQTTKISLDMKNSSIEKILQTIEEKSEFYFLYNSKLIDVDRKMNIHANEESITSILNRLFGVDNVDYEVEGTQIILHPKQMKLVSSRGISSEQQEKRTITGTITDEQGEPIIGANILELNTSNGTITDIDGNFSLQVNSNAILHISYIGYLSQEVNTAGKTVFSIRLEEDTHALDELVVIGYGTSRKKDLTGAVASVKADDLNVITSSSVSQMLQGKVSGMNMVQRTSQPGAGISVNIRGAVSPSGNNSPLFVIDGVPILNNSSIEPTLNQAGYQLETGVDRDPLNSLNPSDIESIEVLKDASAAAIYGASAANGVVLITTKSGKSGKAKVEFRSTITSQIQKNYYEVLGAKDFREQTNLWTKEYFLYQNRMGVYGPNSIDLTEYTPIFSNINDYSASTNWMEEVTRRGYIIDQNLSVNGGSDRTTYFFSYNYYDNIGLLKNSDLNRHAIRLNLDQKFSEHLKGGINMSYSNVTSESTSFGVAGNGDNMILNALRFGPDIPIKDENGNYSRSHNKQTNNPVAFLDITDETNNERIFVAPTIELKILDGLTLKGVGGYDNQTSYRKFYIPVSTLNVSMPDGQGQLGYSKATSLSAESFFNYDKTFRKDHRISAVLGAGYYKIQNYGFGLMGVGFFTDAFGADNVGIADDKERQRINSTRKERTKLSQFVRLNYSLMDKYIFTFTGRRDGSSYFSENNKWGFFPSLSFAWRVNEESFMKEKTIFSDLKLRVGYGTSGNENVLGKNSQSLYQSGYNYLIGNTMHTGLALTQIENPNLKWETNTTLNVGIDYGFLNQRVSGSIELFHRGVKDLLDFQILPSNNAVGRMAANIGETKSEGFEFSMRSVNITNTKFSWETNLNATFFKTNWVKRNPEVALADYIGEKDELDAIYGWKTDGIITSVTDIPSFMPNAVIGNVKYVDVNEDDILDSKDVVKLGNSTPRWFVGLGNSFSYKNFDLNFYFYGAFDYKKWRGQVPSAANLGNKGTAPGNTYISIKTDVWESQTETGWMPGIATNVYSSSNPSGNNDFFLMNGSYIKLKNITLGYTLPGSMFSQNKFIQGARFFVDAQNIATFTNYVGFDPEMQTDNPYPQALSLSFGFNIDF